MIKYSLDKTRSFKENEDFLIEKAKQFKENTCGQIEDLDGPFELIVLYDILEDSADYTLVQDVGDTKVPEHYSESEGFKLRLEAFFLTKILKDCKPEKVEAHLSFRKSGDAKVLFIFFNIIWPDSIEPYTLSDQELHQVTRFIVNKTGYNGVVVQGLVKP